MEHFIKVQLSKIDARLVDMQRDLNALAKPESHERYDRLLKAERTRIRELVAERDALQRTVERLRADADDQESLNTAFWTRRAGYVLAMAVLQSNAWEGADDELREAVERFTSGDRIPPANARPEGASFHFEVEFLGEPAAGLSPYNEEVTITAHSGDVGDRGAFVDFCFEALRDLFPGAQITFRPEASSSLEETDESSS